MPLSGTLSAGGTIPVAGFGHARFRARAVPAATRCFDSLESDRKTKTPFSSSIVVYAEFGDPQRQPRRSIFVLAASLTDAIYAISHLRQPLFGRYRDLRRAEKKVVSATVLRYRG